MCALDLFLEIKKKSNTNLPQQYEYKNIEKIKQYSFHINNWYKYKMDHLDN